MNDSTNDLSHNHQALPADVEAAIAWLDSDECASLTISQFCRRIEPLLARLSQGPAKHREEFTRRVIESLDFGPPR